MGYLMALKVQYQLKHGRVLMRSGYLYTFQYLAYQHDKNPLIIFLNSFSGTHPVTKRQWRFFQAINLTYLPRAKRLRFVKSWMKTLKRSGSVRLTWQKVKSQYPELKVAMRRYFYSPKYYVRSLVEIKQSATKNLNEAYSNKQIENMLIGSKISSKKTVDADMINSDKIKELQEWVVDGGLVVEAVRSCMSKDFSSRAMKEAILSMYGKKQHMGMEGKLRGRKSKLPRGRTKPQAFGPPKFLTLGDVGLE